MSDVKSTPKPSKLSLPESEEGCNDDGTAGAVDSPVARGDVSPTTGNFTFELLPAKVNKKGKRKKGGKRNGRKGRRGRGGNRAGKPSTGREDPTTASGQLSGGVFYPTQYAPPLPSTDVVLQQLHFRFSPEMLSSDRYLRQNMDRGGWVPVWVVAQLGEFVHWQWGLAILDVIRECLANSPKLTYDADNDLIRLSSDWQKWLFPADTNLTEDESMWGSQWHVFGDEEDEDDYEVDDESPTVVGAGVKEQTSAAAEQGSGNVKAKAVQNSLSASAIEFVPKTASTASGASE